MQVKDFLPTTPLSPFDPTNKEACHFRIIRKKLHLQKLESLIALSVIVRESWARGPMGRGWPIAFKFLPQTTSHMIKNIPFLSGLTLTTPLVFGLFA